MLKPSVNMQHVRAITLSVNILLKVVNLISSFATEDPIKRPTIGEGKGQ